MRISILIVSLLIVGMISGQMPISTQQDEKGEEIKPQIQEDAEIDPAKEEAWRMINEAMGFESHKPPASPSVSNKETKDNEVKKTGLNSREDDGEGSGKQHRHGQVGSKKRPPGWDKGDKEGWDSDEPPGLKKAREAKEKGKGQKGGKK